MIPEVLAGALQPDIVKAVKDYQSHTAKLPPTAKTDKMVEAEAEVALQKYALDLSLAISKHVIEHIKTAADFSIVAPGAHITTVMSQNTVLPGAVTAGSPASQVTTTPGTSLQTAHTAFTITAPPGTSWIK